MLVCAEGDDYFFNAVVSPVELFPGDDERRGDADDVIVGLLAEDAFFLEGFAVGARAVGELDADPQAAAADLFDGGTLDGLQAGEEPGA